jgi:ribosomal protein L28
MAYRCDLCGKGSQASRLQTHKPGVAGGQWKKRAPEKNRRSLPNLHIYRGYLLGDVGKWTLCTKCQRLVRNAAKEALEPKKEPEVKAA